jgi:hypothetical protein
MEGLETIQRSLDEIKGVLEGLNSEPHGLPATSVQGPADAASQAPQSQRSLMSSGDVWAVRSLLREKDARELHGMFAEQASKSDQGVPLGAWLASGGTPRQAAFGNMHANELAPEVQKLLDTSSGSALIRQDLEPILYEMFVREMPAFDRFAKEPANGLVHTYQQITAFGGAEFMGELGNVSDDKSTYQRLTTNIAIVATRRGVSLKNQFAALQSGSGFNPENLELTGGLRALAKKMQDTIFGGHSTDSGGTTSNELGAYDANGFTGLRALLNTGTSFVKNVDPATNPDTTGSIRRAIGDALVEIMNAGPGRPSIIWANPLEVEEFGQQQDTKQRWPGQTVNIAPGTEVDGVMTVFGRLPLGAVPGTSIASYTSTQYSSNTVRDMYALDESTISLPYLGSEGPTVLEIPTGISGQLTKLYIIFGMWGLAVKALNWNNKIRVKV